METIKQVGKQIGLVLTLLGVLLVLCELPHHDRNYLSHQERTAQLGTTGTARIDASRSVNQSKRFLGDKGLAC